MTAPDDDRLLALLGRALEQGDPVPASVRHAAVGAFTWRTIDAELAALVYDSGMEEVVGARSDQVTRQLTFERDGLEIEVMVVPEAGMRLIGQLVPPRRALVRLVSREGQSETTSDDLGRFRFESFVAGPARLQVSPGAGEPPIETEWVIF